MEWYQNLPLHIDPIVFSIGFFEVRWYAISYLVGFAVVYGLLMLRIKRGEYNPENQKSKIKNQNGEIRNTKYEIRNTILDFLLVTFFSALIGGRIGYVLLYDFSYFFSNPLSIISPFDRTGNFIGLYGMSYHGGLVGIIIGAWIFLKIKKISFWQWADFVVPAVPLGYFFGRMGNFLNGELYGRVTNSSLGMYFSNDPQNLRYPSQLFEAFLEGLVLFAILWKMRNRKMPSGITLAMYIAGYGLFRIICEFWREPDPQIGFLFSSFTMGQVLSFIMIFAGINLFLKRRKDDIIS